MVAALSTPSEEATCSIERTLGIVGERWTFVILREVLINGVERFADLQEALKIAPNILSDRLATLVNSGVLEKKEYREGGARPRMSYHPTRAGTELLVVLAALQQWGDDHVPPRNGPTVVRVANGSDEPMRIGFASAADLLSENVVFRRTDSYPE